MKKLFLLLFGFFLIGATYDHSVQISTGQTVIDSVVAYIETDNTKLDSAKWFSFPVDSFITVPDTTPLVLEYRFYYKIDSASGTYRTTSELLSGNPHGGWIDSNKTEQGGIAGATIPFYVYTIDTSGADDTVSIANVTLNDATGSPRDGGPTNSAGFIQFTVTSGDWLVSAAATGFHFDDSTYTVTVNDTVALHGYDIQIGSPAGGNECRLFGYAQDILDTVDALADVWAHIEMLEAVNNTCDSTLVVRFSKRKLVDAVTGLWTFDVARSSCISDKKYSIWLEYEGGQKTTKAAVTAPDAATFRVFWTGGN